MRRILAVARVRFAEGRRGPLPAFLLVFAGLAVAAALGAGGEPGPDRQRTVDGYVLDAALLLSALAAAGLGAASLAADRESGRESVLAAGPLRPHETLIGGLVGHAAVLALLLGGMLALGTTVTEVLTGGSGDRAPTREQIREARLAGGSFRLDEEGETATIEILAPRGAVFDGPDPRAFVGITEYESERARNYPSAYPVAVRPGRGAEREVLKEWGRPLEVELDPGDFPEGAPLAIRLRRVDEEYDLEIVAVAVHGRRRPLLVNLAKAGAAWLLGLLVVAAGAAALSTVVGAPVAAAATLALVLLGRGLPQMAETAGYLARGGSSLGASVLEGAVRVLPDFRAYDLTTQVVTRWDAPATLLLERAGAAAVAVAVLLAAARLLLFARRR